MRPRLRSHVVVLTPFSQLAVGCSGWTATWHLQPAALFSHAAHGRNESSLLGAAEPQHHWPIGGTAVDFSGDDARLTIGDREMVHALSLEDGATLRTFRHTEGRVRAVAISSTGSHLFVGGFDKQVRTSLRASVRSCGRLRPSCAVAPPRLQAPSAATFAPTQARTSTHAATHHSIHAARNSYSPQHPRSYSPQHPRSYSPHHPRSYSLHHPRSYSPHHPRSYSPRHPRSYSPRHPRSYSPHHPRSYSPHHPRSYSPHHPRSYSPHRPRDRSPAQVSVYAICDGARLFAFDAPPGGTVYAVTTSRLSADHSGSGGASSAQVPAGAGAPAMPSADRDMSDDTDDRATALVALGGEAADGTGFACVYSSHTLEPCYYWRRDKAVRSIALTRDGSQCAVGANDNKVLVHDIRLNYVATTLHLDPHPRTGLAYVWALAFSPDDTRLVVGSWNGTVHVYRNELRQATPPPGGVGGVGVGAGAEHCAPCADDGRNEASRAVAQQPARRAVNHDAILSFTPGDGSSDSVPRIYALALNETGDRVLVGARDLPPVLYYVGALGEIDGHGVGSPGKKMGSPRHAAADGHTTSDHTPSRTDSRAPSVGRGAATRMFGAPMRQRSGHALLAPGPALRRQLSRDGSHKSLFGSGLLPLGSAAERDASPADELHVRTPRGSNSGAAMEAPPPFLICDGGAPTLLQPSTHARHPLKASRELLTCPPMPLLSRPLA